MTTAQKTTDQILEQEKINLSRRTQDFEEMNRTIDRIENNYARNTISPNMLLTHLGTWLQPQVWFVYFFDMDKELTYVFVFTDAAAVNPRTASTD